MTTEAFAEGAIKLTVARVAELQINRPDKCNAMTARMWQGLLEACRRIAKLPEIRVLIFAGVGKHFCAGADIGEFSQTYATDASAETYNATYRAAETALRELPVPVIAQIRGACLGGGLGLALSSDLRFADSTARIAITASKLGVTYSAEDAARIMEKIGPARSKDMLFSARTIGAEEAFSWGLIDRLASANDLAGIVDSYASEIAARSPASLKAMKIIINTLTDPEPDKCHKLRPTYSELFRGRDLDEGRRAFLEKREPVFD
ncbi:enoyl-CoA hydratase-related protein [Rhizobium sp. BK068]|uniref:enoyl-CoA hydratase/isomerase family protein n=1 Tax=Rhizobium sp. BK068 TaxID=2512130 RepID=UPI0010497A8B|nr:enoyl-CoA hydratase-related protein [Rhizobium sp. BK068]TCM74945.1 enoyl-CoA hydratase/carnithine racemase [Rhizobium sp. BK068]